MSIREHPKSGTTAARVIPINAPSRAELWKRHQLARACLNHGRVNRAELLRILDGAEIDDLARPGQVG